MNAPKLHEIAMPYRGGGDIFHSENHCVFNGAFHTQI